ncbi:LysR family transcriptional regulator [uncultured Tolumonas sp.]|uniref:LysR family transcriptional regulator n=1 Tax=uncultured Tolumonas sp. TaxID=263765 RepID=UPI00292D5A11|nr:LysR family transcriptional regulator [uncultured Tolumonas sp.]
MLSKSELLHVFVIAAESKTFRDAASKLNMSPQSVSRVIKSLEDTYGELLFHRNTRTIRITKFGEQLLAGARHALDVVNDIFLLGKQKQLQDELCGTVTITTPSLIGKDYLYPLLRDFKKKHPDIQIDVRSSNSFSHLVDEQIDIGIRVGRIKNNGFIVRKVNEVRFFIVATPDVIEQIGEPKNIYDLRKLPAIESIDCNSGRGWAWMFAEDIDFHPDNVAFRTDDPEIELLAVRDGMGFGQLSDWIVKEDIRQKKLVRILKEAEPNPWDVYVYRPQRGPVPARVRLLYDCIVEYMQKIDFHYE